MKVKRAVKMRSYKYTKVLVYIYIVVLTLWVLNSWQLKKRDSVFEFKNDTKASVAQNDSNICIHEKLEYWVLPSSMERLTTNLVNIHKILIMMGYTMKRVRNANESWNLLWSRQDPVKSKDIGKLKPDQRVGYMPGIEHIGYKADLVTKTDSKYIPKAFKLPADMIAFADYASQNKDSLFLIKNNYHKGVSLKNVSEIMNMKDGKSFVQEYMQKPFLVDGHKFDMGVYVLLTSVNPLRVYWYKGDVGFRFCPAKYYPFDPTNVDKYVVREKYLPTWKVPALDKAYNKLGFGIKDSFDIYARSRGKNTTKMWEEVLKAITEIFVLKENDIIAAVSVNQQHVKYINHIVNKLKSNDYTSSENFFHLLRFDLIVDEDLKVYLLEANSTPNLNQVMFPPHKTLFEQVIYNMFSVVGINRVRECGGKAFSTLNMMSATKNIAVWGTECHSMCKSCLGVCGLCSDCAGPDLRRHLLRAHDEYLRKGDFRRLIPPSMTQNQPPFVDELHNISEINMLLHLWFQGKCNIDITWCN